MANCADLAGDAKLVRSTDGTNKFRCRVTPPDESATSAPEDSDLDDGSAASDDSETVDQTFVIFVAVVIAIVLLVCIFVIVRTYSNRSGSKDLTAPAPAALYSPQLYDQPTPSRSGTPGTFALNTSYGESRPATPSSGGGPSAYAMTDDALFSRVAVDGSTSTRL